MEFTLDPAFRKPQGVRAVFFTVLSVLLAVPAAAGGPLFAVLVTLSFIAALGYGIKWWGRLNFRTSVSQEGIEARGYFVRQIPWGEVEAIQIVDRERITSVRTRRRNSGSGAEKKVASIKVIRHSGRAVELRAPLVTRGVSDSRFDDKAHALRQALAAYRASTMTVVES